jgi:hypothetical protein
MITPRPWTFAYCRACQRTVRVAYTPAPAHEGHANIPDGPEVVCLEANDPSCQGVCPLTNMEHAVMQLRLNESGMLELEPRKLP